ncbi:uncharacterized protein LOC135709586 [Ochlerotatus camptorhynchus]|uniref:uncharacterized protein LOC135709586 n=1 Tax=Ochlerotatus camptorhynchus TaxID=644619 RepID=UPI0031D76E4E
MEKKKTNKRQFACLVAFMEENPDIARGSKNLNSWESDSLNSFGPPTHSVAAWQKVWTDKKLQLKRKLQHNKNELTGSVFGTQSSPSPSAIGERQADRCVEDPIEEPRVTEDQPTHDSVTREDGRGQPATSGRGRATKQNYRKNLLEKQTDDLSKMKLHVSDCARYSRKSYDLHKKRFELEMKRFQLDEEKINFNKQMLLEKQKHKSQQLQYKKQKLDFEI